MAELLILCYHAVSEKFPASLSVSPTALRSQLRTLVHRGYRGATFSDALARPPEGRTLVVTFDDAYRSVVRLGFPILDELGLPATVFAPTAYIGSERPMCWDGIERWHDTAHEAELTPCSWPELEMLVDAGWEVGSHTRTHPRLPELADGQLAGELRGSRRDCERRLGVPCRSIAYPYGAVDRRVAEAVADAGYLFAAELPGDFRAPVAALRCPRIGLYHRDAPWRFRLKTAGMIRALRGTAAWEMLDRTRHVREPLLVAGLVLASCDFTSMGPG
ncbi:MAG TPA: polysaccharide deacetylase family protein [Solirubrobacterales bacterium]|jgi:peptidoglycan/xylan/chitin deacetylase (PgdA/CDA1 family)